MSNRSWSRPFHIHIGAAMVLVAGSIIALMASRASRLPGPATAASSPPANVSRCQSCHAEIASSFPQTEHGNTLRKPDRELHERVAQLKAAHPEGLFGIKLFFREEDDRSLAISGPNGRVALPVNWWFGSGKHAQTPVCVWLNDEGDVEALECRVSWYPSHGWGATLGLTPASKQAGKNPAASASASPSWLESLGKVHDPAATRACFECHTTYLPFAADGRNFDWSRIVSGVSCERCHPGGERHAQARDRGANKTRRDNWRELTPLEAVNRCGECHRRADHLTPDELRPENKLLVRFASVGLVQSACFRKQAAGRSEGQSTRAGNHRLDCITCHDPHRPAESDWKFYVERCATCHAADAPRCSQQPLDSNCLPCHMPHVEVQPPLKFTDHWIRQRTDQ